MVMKGNTMPLYRPDYLLEQARQQTDKAWFHYQDCLHGDATDKHTLAARDVYIKAAGMVVEINREIKKRVRTRKKPIQA